MGRQKAQVGIHVGHSQIVAVIVGAGRGGVALHLFKDLVHHITLHQGLLLDEQVGGGGDLGGIGGIVGIAQVFQRHAQGVPGVVEHQDLPGVVFVEQNAQLSGAPSTIAVL